MRWPKFSVLLDQVVLLGSWESLLRLHYISRYICDIWWGSLPLGRSETHDAEICVDYLKSKKVEVETKPWHIKFSQTPIWDAVVLPELEQHISEAQPRLLATIYNVPTFGIANIATMGLLVLRISYRMLTLADLCPSTAPTGTPGATPLTS